MSAEPTSLAPITAEERQAVQTVSATRNVFVEIERLADIIKESWRPATERIDAKHDLLHASERLCNLMSLALYQLDNNVSGALAEKLKQDLDELRNRLMGLGSRLMVEKLEKIDKRAEAVLQDRDYPIGLAGKLDIAFANLMANLKVLGGPERLGEKVPDLVVKTEENLKSLAEIEQKVGALVDMQPKKKRP
jgi:hypothetical protein